MRYKLYKDPFFNPKIVKLCKFFTFNLVQCKKCFMKRIPALYFHSCCVNQIGNILERTLSEGEGVTMSKPFRSRWEGNSSFSHPGHLGHLAWLCDVSVSGVWTFPFLQIILLFFPGSTCARPFRYCGYSQAASPCYPNGFCLEHGNGYKCLCSPGWAGPTCGNTVNDCDNNNCTNGATCVDLHLSYQCKCPPGWDGTYCERVKNNCELNPCQNSATCISKFADFE
jgi:hypothetical protein